MFTNFMIMALNCSTWNISNVVNQNNFRGFKTLLHFYSSGLNHALSKPTTRCQPFTISKHTVEEMLFLYVQMGKTGPNSYLLVLQYCTFLHTINRSWYIYIQILLSKIKYKKKKTTKPILTIRGAPWKRRKFSSSSKMVRTIC